MPVLNLHYLLCTFKPVIIYIYLLFIIYYLFLTSLGYLGSLKIKNLNNF